MDLAIIKQDFIRQISAFWYDSFVSEWDELDYYLETAVKTVEKVLEASHNKYYEQYGFNHTNSVQYCLFLYHLSHLIGTSAGGKSELIALADRTYYLNKIMNGVDWYWGIELPEYMMCEHPIGTVLGRASYGNYFFVYQGCTVGGNRKNGRLCYPSIGNFVLLYSNSKILGDSHIGNNVIIAANTMIVDEDIPDNAIVFGQSPNLIIKKKTEEYVRNKMNHIWPQNKVD